MIVVTVARKPLDGTAAANCLKWGTGCLNIDGGRIPLAEDEHAEKRPILAPVWNARGLTMNGLGPGATAEKSQAAIHAGIDAFNDLGRFPANVILTDGVGLPNQAERYFYRSRSKYAGVQESDG